MEKVKKISWFAKLLFGKFCLMPGYSKHLEFYQVQAEYSQRREDEFVENEIERLAQEQYSSYIQEMEKWVKVSENIKCPELKKIFTPTIWIRTYPYPYRIYNDSTAKFKNEIISIDGRIQERYNELMGGRLDPNKEV